MKQFLVVGLGRFGTSVASTLFENDESILALDKNEDIVQESINNNLIDNGITVDATDMNTLKNLGVSNFDVAFVCIGTNIQDSILITLNLKELGIPKIIAKALTEAHGKVLKKIGADEIIFPEVYMGQRVALKEIDPNILEHIKFSDKHILVEIKAPNKFYGKTLEKLALRKKYNINIIGIKRSDKELEINPMGDTKIENGDTLIAITDSKTAKELEEL
ncbi:potassium channel family protein [Haliovirga abyssi]|uniref:Potassium transporter KtrA n=1 Tax=Haliovirga abyssi TaxID=2996794 RepID=A0AAU9DT61_9FUSO|nr:TrkA family potassium uptake protein [Haliovirga abyssi]BDU50304.1 potassium transporter KtrA [Haliovirga abyssi]